MTVQLPTAFPKARSSTTPTGLPTSPEIAATTMKADPHLQKDYLIGTIRHNKALFRG